ncbi:preprotein translocase subunit YajC [Pullulanibacillus pueri]|uniref:Preprotein translocase subunit YajC n=1 Tax=Pullulanibacillus pueri TaxID=1437324 RepID=A0A8J3ENW8_9BACL|nr:preprotein translocase subunit YajC [Pullulanibacillus pueri]MBM7683271.1 preprotein translocase subunit YajC [Pullulanibacillus pueri]GGH85790.1 preprotein translocase subunit YajC [Pullulanibacillus pueri]
MGGAGSIIMLVIFFAIFYFLLIRPQQKRQKKTQEMQSSLEKGDKITTIGGLHGIVDVIEDGQVTIKCNGNTKLTFDRNAIREIVQKKVNPHEKDAVVEKETEEAKQES